MSDGAIDPRIARARDEAWQSRRLQIDAAAAREAEFGDGPPDVEAIARAASADSPDGARVRRLAVRARERRAEARTAVEMAEDHVAQLARGLVKGSVAEDAVVAAIAERDELRRVLEAWDTGIRELGGHPALAGRR